MISILYFCPNELSLINKEKKQYVFGNGKCYSIILDFTKPDFVTFSLSIEKFSYLNILSVELLFCKVNIDSYIKDRMFLKQFYLFSSIRIKKKTNQNFIRDTFYKMQ